MQEVDPAQELYPPVKPAIEQGDIGQMQTTGT